MQLEKQLQIFIESMKSSLTLNTFVKLSFGNYKGNEVDLKNIYVKKILIKAKEHLSFTYRYKTRDIVKNYSIDESFDIVSDFLQKKEFNVATLITTEGDTQLEFLSGKKIVLRQLKTSQTSMPDVAHDKIKKRHIEANAKSFLYDLNITNAEGLVLKHAQDKYKQINHYIELLKVTLEHLPKDELFEVVDMGSGKGYLTFALYNYLSSTLQLNTKVTGVEYREDLVDLCNSIAKKHNMINLHFEKGSIKEYDCKKINMLIALHACDTATDEAIYKGITANANLIVVAPCCHKQIRNEIENGKKQNELNFILRHGIYLEREAEMITDSIRALILEYYGYKTKVFEFISEAHTPKNIMIIAEKIKTKPNADNNIILQKIKDAKNFFGIKIHHLESLMEI